MIEENKVAQDDPEMQRAIQVANQADEQERMQALREENQDRQAELAQVAAGERAAQGP